MEIIFQGQHNCEEAAESFLSVLRLFKDHYHIENFKEMHLMVTLMDTQGDEVELVDTETSQAYRTFEVYRRGEELTTSYYRKPHLKLVIDNTDHPKK